MRNKIMRVWLLAIATCFLIIGIIDGGAPPSTAQANAVLPSVSIVPEDEEVLRGESFNVNVVVDSTTYNLKACHVEVSYDPSAFTAGVITEAGLLGTDILSEPGSGVTDGLVKYGVTRVAGNTPEPVSGALITIAFTVSEDALSDSYTLDVQNTILKDEDNNTIYGVLENDGLVTVTVETIEDQLAPIADETQMLYYYDNATKTWSYYWPGVGGTLDVLTTGLAYWINVSADCTIDSTPLYAGWNLMVW